MWTPVDPMLTAKQTETHMQCVYFPSAAWRNGRLLDKWKKPKQCYVFLEIFMRILFKDNCRAPVSMFASVLTRLMISLSAVSDTVIASHRPGMAFSAIL